MSGCTLGEEEPIVQVSWWTLRGVVEESEELGTKHCAAHMGLAC